MGKLEVMTKKGGNSSEGQQQGERKIQWCSKLADRYELGAEVMPSCHSGMQVLFAKQKKTGLEVVIKVRIKKQSFKDGEEKEWRISTQYMLNLPESHNIAKIYEVLEDVDAYYVVMEKCQGQDLFECLHGTDKLSMEEVRSVLTQILTALADLHAEGIIHKDLKLENVMIDRTPSTCGSGRGPWSEKGSVQSPASPLAVKLVDFDTVEEYVPETPKKTKDVLGTDQYIAQEAYAGNYSPASDVFAVGVIGYRLIVGRFPFDSRMFNDQPGENWVGSPKMKEIRDKLCRYQINYEHKALKNEPDACALIKSMLAVNEGERPSAKEALQHRWLASSRSSSHTATTRGPSRSSSLSAPGSAAEIEK